MGEQDNDPYVGETFEDLDPRSRGRRIRVLAVHPDQHSDRILALHPERRAYRAIRVNEYGEPVGQHVRIMAKTLAEKYQKVSRG